MAKGTGTKSKISIQDGKLMLLVLKNEELYDLSNPNFTNAKRRETIWGEISKSMKQPVNWCRDRWEELREIHRNAVRLLQTTVDDVPPEKSDPKMFTELNSLFPSVCKSETKAEVAGTDSESNEGGEAIEINEDVPVVKHSTSNVSIKIGNQDGTKASLVKILQEFLELKKNELEKDPLTRFFISMAQTVKEFPVQDQVDIRGKLFDLVHTVEKRILSDQNELPPIEEIILTDKPIEEVPIPTDIFHKDCSLRSFMSEYVHPEELLERLNEMNKTMNDKETDLSNLSKIEDVAETSNDESQQKQKKISISEPPKPVQREIKMKRTFNSINPEGARASLKDGHDNKPKQVSFNNEQINEELKKLKRKKENRNSDVRPVL